MRTPWQLKLTSEHFLVGPVVPCPPLLPTKAFSFTKFYQAGTPEFKPNLELYANAALLQLGVNDTNKIRVEKIK